MIDKTTRILAIGVFALSMLFATPAECGSAESDEQTTMEDVRKEAGETAEAMKEFAGQQKQKFVDEAESALEKLDGQIQSYKQRIEEKWNEMDRQARQQAEKTLETLKEKREALAGQLKSLKRGSAEAWEKMKKEFWDSYESLKDSLNAGEQEVKYI